MPLYSLDDVSPHVPPEGQWWLAPDAHVVGRCHIARDVGIWFGAVIRGDNDPIRVGARTNIQEHAMLHTDLGFPLSIGEDCTIGHRAILHGCTIGNGVLIGMGATILNGAVIPDGCLVGANALVTEGKVFEPNTLIVGAPAKAIRTLDEAALQRLKQSADSYVQNWKRFSAVMKRLETY
jgi:carbonic anhydrase/acetyltransferase-like protein (isoleucine patch superfamily)